MTTSARADSRARAVVIAPLARAAARFPNLEPSDFQPTRGDLSERDASLAAAIHRTALERWMTIEHLLDQFLRQPFRNLEPTLRAILLAGAGQVLFMSKLPAHAVVNESVDLARRLVRPGAGAMVNAVLRRMAELVKTRHEGSDWVPDVDALPMDGGWVELSGPCLPDPDHLAKHLAIVTSHPVSLVRKWIDAHGADRARGLCLHSLKKPPTIVAVEEDFDPGDGAGSIDAHEHGGFVVWRGGHAALESLLRANRARRVQDPTAASAVEATRTLQPGTILDYCAGRGTKTRQLLAMHRNARVYGSDRDRSRLQDLRSLQADETDRLTVVSPGDLVSELPEDGVGLLLLDAPCSNTGVLARRLEARYRFGDRSVDSLVNLQRDIIRAALPLVKGGGYVLYSTCSIDSRENEDQVRHELVERSATVIAERLTLPDGRGVTYRDGGYWALVRMPA